MRVQVVYEIMNTIQLGKLCPEALRWDCAAS
jgi:hypothetical protein